MKLRSIRLHNVRKFTDAVEITGIAPGLNVLAAPNEQGKSTIFDALHALFFKDAKSWDKEVRTLAPHAGGEPNIQVEIDVDGNTYRIEKQFLKASGKGDIRIWKNGNLSFQADAAEAWLKELMQPPKEGGPAGLLWVRQGLTSFEDAKETLQARRGLLSSVSGEVSAVTGGQRMDRIRHEIEAELDRLVTKRGARKNGPLDLAQTAVGELEEKRATLSQKAQDLQAQLQQRKLLRAEWADLSDPEERKAQEHRLAAARDLVDASARHLEQQRQVQREIGMAKEALAGRQAQISTLKDQQQEVDAAQEAVRTAAKLLQDAQGTQTQAEQKFIPCQLAEKTAQEALQKARKDLEQIARQEAGAHLGEQAKTLAARVEQVQSLIKRAADLKAKLSQGPDAKTTQELETLNDTLTVARQVQEAGAASIVVSYLSGKDGAVLSKGQPLVDGQRMPLSGATRLEIRGVGDLVIDPGQAQALNGVPKAEAELEGALLRAGFETMADMRLARAGCQAAEGHLKEAGAQLQILAPDGLEALLAELQLCQQKHQAVLSSSDEPSVDLPDPDEARNRVSAAQLALEEAQVRLEAAREALSSAQTAHLLAKNRLEEARHRLERAAGKGQVPQDLQARLAELEKGLPDLAAAISTAQAASEALAEQTIDMAQAQASLKRAQSVVEGTQQRVQELGRLLASLDARIETYAGEAVEEELAETEEQLAKAQKRLREVEFEVSVLQRLRQALEQASSAAQDAYVGPILQELKPLLGLLWPGADLAVDADDLLPNHLDRSGQADAFSTLSGGTREQIALLVRLAFARLLAKAGRAAPVILDDAIVYTDDARIQKIFDALTYQANDLQILVFSCRQKAFRDLGGTRLSIRPVEMTLG